MTTHFLKTHLHYFTAIKAGYKNFELRKNDRDFKPNDILCLQEFNEVDNVYTGESLWFSVTYILYGGVFGLDKDYVIMGLKPLNI